MESDGRQEGEGCGVDTVEDGGGEGGLAEPGYERSDGGGECEGGQEDSDGGGQCSGRSGQGVAEERGGGEDGTGGDLSGGDGVEELRGGEPLKAVDEIGLEEAEEDVAAAVYDGPELEEIGEEDGEAWGVGGEMGRMGREGGGEGECGREDEGGGGPAGARCRTEPMDEPGGRTGKGEGGEGGESGGGGEQGRCGDGARRGGAEGGAGQFDRGLEDDDENDGLDAVEQGGGLRKRSELAVQHGEQVGKGGGRQDETDSGGEQAGESGAAVADLHGDFGGVRPWDEVGGADAIEEFGLGEPAAAVNELMPHEGDMGGGPAKGRKAEAKEDGGDFGDSQVSSI